MKKSDPFDHYCSLIRECINSTIVELSGTNPNLYRSRLDSFTQAFIEAFLKDVNDNEAERSRSEREDGVSLHAMDYDIKDISPKTLARIIKDCKKFQSDHDDAIREGGTNFDDPYEQAGYDFYFTRTGAGVGFWETDDWPDPYGKELNSAAKKFGGVDGYVGDDKKVYIMGAEGDWTAGGVIQGINVPSEEKPYDDGYGEDENEDEDEDDTIKEGGSKLKSKGGYEGLTSDMEGKRWTIHAFDHRKSNKKETPPID